MADIYECFGSLSPNTPVHWKDGGELEPLPNYTMLGIYELKNYRCSKCGAICNGQTGEVYGPRIGYEIYVLGKKYSVNELAYADELLFKGL